MLYCKRDRFLLFFYTALQYKSERDRDNPEEVPAPSSGIRQRADGEVSREDPLETDPAGAST